MNGDIMGNIINCETYKDDENFDRLHLTLIISEDDIETICKSLKDRNQDVTFQTKDWDITITT